jgi:hypothetical protein
MMKFANFVFHSAKKQDVEDINAPSSDPSNQSSRASRSPSLGSSNKEHRMCLLVRGALAIGARQQHQSTYPINLSQT